MVRRLRRRLPRRAVLVTVVFVAGACGGSDGVERPAAPKPPPLFNLTIKEYSYSPGAGTPTAIPAGRVNFRLRNDGDLGHQPALILVPDDFPPMAEQVRGDVRRGVRILANNAGIPAGVTAAVAVDLEPGRRYAFMCIATSPEGEQHSRRGMVWEFRTNADPNTTITTAPTTASTEPVSTSTTGTPAAS